MKINKLTSQPEEIKLVLIEAVLTPKGELIRNGKSLGWHDKKLFELDSQRLYEIIENDNLCPSGHKQDEDGRCKCTNSDSK